MDDTLSIILKKKAATVRMAWTLCAVVCVTFGVFCLFAVRASRVNPMVFVIGTDGTIVFGSLEQLDSESLVFKRISQLGAEVALTRNPKGLQKEQFLPVIFTEKAREKLIADVDKQKTELESKEMHQHVEVRKVDYYKDTKGVRTYLVEGQVIQSGFIQQMPFNASYRFRMAVALVDNTNLATKGMWPYLVDDFQIKID